MTVGEIGRRLGAEVEGDANREITGVQSLEEAAPDQIAFVEGARGEKQAAASRAGCLLVRPEFENPGKPTIIRVAAPRAAFARVVGWLRPPQRPTPGLHPAARVAETARLGERVSVGAGAVIGEGVVVGDDSVIHPGVILYPGVKIGARAILHAGCVIGADGFGFVFENGRYEKFPQVGTVEIGDDVEIGANSCVDRGALGATRIGDGTKLDNMVHIGHNCRIGRHVVIAAQTGLSGGVEVGDYAVIGGQVGIGDKAKIESGAVLGSGCGVLTSKIVRKGEPVWGTPARPLKQYLKRLALFDRLPKILEKLEKK